MTSKVKALAIIVSSGTALFSGYEIYTGNPKFYSDFVLPALQNLTSAETAHNLAIKAARYGFHPHSKFESHRLETQVFGKTFKSPIGLAAGFDKHIEAVDGLLSFGFGFIEVGGVTPEPQPGNQKPRVFRLKEDCAIINRYGFNSHGHTATVERLKAWYDSKSNGGEVQGIVGVNLGKNKTTEDAASDYVKGVHTFGPYVDFLVINVSSPNTQGLRDLQGKEQLQSIVKQVVKARDELECKDKPPILIKIAPDLTEKDKIDIASVVTVNNSGIAGLIISNTTITRPESLLSTNKSEKGGLSGRPLRDLSTQLIRDMYKLTGGKLVIIGVGGVFTGQDAFEKIKAGADLVQLYSALAYHGPPVVNQIKIQLDGLLEADGYDSVVHAVGAEFTEK